MESCADPQESDLKLGVSAVTSEGFLRSYVG